MAKIRPVDKAMFFVGMISSHLDLFKEVEHQLKPIYGFACCYSDKIPFERTSYYKPEMGAHLNKQFFAFERLGEQDHLADFKILTNDLEQRLASPSGQRRINIDPGYLTAAKVVLATTKDFSHRLYLKQGIYGEITLSFVNKKIQGHPWTYPDYLTEPYGLFFKQARAKYMKEVTSAI